MATPGTVYRGDDARALVATLLEQHESGVKSVLARYSRRSAVLAWTEVMRGVDEFLNVLWFRASRDPDFDWLTSCRIDGDVLSDARRMPRIVEIVTRCHGETVARRFRRTVVQLAEADRVFRERRIAPTGLANGIDTIEAGKIYLQSRRRHFVSVLYSMPELCTGDQVLSAIVAFPTLACLVEHSCATITGLHQQQLLIEVHPDFALVEKSGEFVGTHQFEELEQNFLEAERLSIVEIQRRPELVAPFDEERCPLEPVFSAAELRNNVRSLRAAYRAFGDDPGFGSMGRMIIALSRRCADDYFVRLRRSELEAIVANQTELPFDKVMRWMVAGPSSYADKTNRHHAFVEVDGELFGNVVLLSRLLNAFKNLHLATRKRFVIHSGFVFEDMVKSSLVGLGFHVRPIKRISRREFDVVATRGDVIFNLQCKNNALDLSLIETAPRLVASANRRLVAYYRRALRKERSRQGLLQAELGLTKIKHFVISRFPVITNDPSIIPFNAIDRIAS